MTKQTTFLALVLASSVFVACSSSSEPSGPTASGGAAGAGVAAGTGGDPAGTGGTSSTAGGASGAAGGTVGCPTFANDGTAVPEVRGEGTMPTPAGGTIVDGTYHLTKWEIYPPGSVDAYMRFETWVVAGGTLQAVSHTDSDPDKRTAGTFPPSGSRSPSTSRVQAPRRYRRRTRRRRPRFNFSRPTATRKCIPTRSSRRHVRLIAK